MKRKNNISSPYLVSEITTSLWIIPQLIGKPHPYCFYIYG
jgi:hypothetical protein